MPTTRPTWTSLLLALATAACATTDPLPPPSGGPYRLGSGDEVRLTVYGDPQMSGEYDVSDAGDLSLPLLGDVPATGLTERQLCDRLADRLRAGHLMTEPSVAADVIRYRPVYVLGEVEHPGSYPYQPGLTMLSAVALAGGFTYRGIKDEATVVRTGSGAAVKGSVTPDDFLEPGDVLSVGERFF